jgi:hypothetical protein
VEREAQRIEGRRDAWRRSQAGCVAKKTSGMRGGACHELATALEGSG